MIPTQPRAGKASPLFVLSRTNDHRKIQHAHFSATGQNYFAHSGRGDDGLKSDPLRPNTNPQSIRRGRCLHLSPAPSSKYSRKQRNSSEVLKPSSTLFQTLLKTYYNKQKSPTPAIIMISSSTTSPSRSIRSSSSAASTLRPAKSWSLFRAEQMSQEDFAARLTNCTSARTRLLLVISPRSRNADYTSTPLPKLDVNDWDLTQILLALFKSLSPGSSARTNSHSEAGIHFTTIFLDEVPCFNLVSVSTDDHPVKSWWESFMSNKTPHRHRPEVSRFLSLGKDWTFSDDLWASIFENCRDLGVGWWALTTTSCDVCLLGVFSRGWYDSDTPITCPSTKRRSHRLENSRSGCQHSG